MIGGHALQFQFFIYLLTEIYNWQREHLFAGNKCNIGIDEN